MDRRDNIFILWKLMALVARIGVLLLSSPPNSDTYFETHQLLQVAGLEISPAEMQGMVCGILAASAEPVLEKWASELLATVEDTAKVTAVQQVLEQLQAQAVDQIDEDDLRLQLMLPGDDAPVTDRSLALRDWCQGFLYGFGRSGRGSVADMSAEAREALHDFGQIAQLDTSGSDDHEGDEQSLMELEEYVRMTALMIRAETAITGRHSSL
jgi:uncharacterized protein YgfB (UPF0149 family)